MCVLIFVNWDTNEIGGIHTILGGISGLSTEDGKFEEANFIEKDESVNFVKFDDVGFSKFYVLAINQERDNSKIVFCFETLDECLTKAESYLRQFLTTNYSSDCVVSKTQLEMNMFGGR